MRNLAICAATLLLAGCSSGPRPVIAPTPGPSATSPANSSSGQTTFRTPRVQQDRSTNAIIGKRAEAIERMFGQARLTSVEGDARKLQFADDFCVLDVFLYPLGPNQAPVATHVEARRPQDGAVIDRADCISALRR